MNKAYQIWANFYMEFADKLLQYSNDRKNLIEKIKNVYKNTDMRLPTLERGEIVDIDPFTIFGLFNKGLTDTNRIALIKSIANEFSVSAPIPQYFDGIPVLTPQMATFYWFIGSRGENDIQNLWNMFISALKYAENPSIDNKNNFVQCYDMVIEQKGVKWNLTMGLYWIRPYSFINLDGRNRWFICDTKNMPLEVVKKLDGLKKLPTALEYLEIIEICKKSLDNGDYPYKNFPELSNCAFIVSEQVNEENKISEKARQDNVGHAIGDSDIQTVHYWIYTPGYGAEKWEEFYKDGIMAIAREYIGDLTQYKTREEMKVALLEKKGADSGMTNGKNASLETWQFLHELKPGDIIFVKRGKHTILGKGIVLSDYIYDASRPNEYKNIRKVNWLHKGEWEHPDGSAVKKVLTDITPYTEYVKKLNALFENEEIEEEIEEIQISYPVYTRENFLDEVYINDSEYDTLVELLRTKKNIVLQGAPGVGKTYAAKRLAYSIMGLKDKSRVAMVQFHQSYSYEDFIMGFRPSATGFELKKGIFYNFCKKAEIDSDNDYFFIIDEINRGNLSKIFGELFMLIENDKRGTEIQLLYADEMFSIPKNVYIIGMMNTADRSLAMMDYALRRRFAFYDMKPGFDSEGFRSYRSSLDNEKFNRLIACINDLNAVIANDDSLGEGFCIGHSYFCNLDTINDKTLSSIVEYEIIPLLKEYWFDEPSKIRDWSDRLRGIVS